LVLLSFGPYFNSSSRPVIYHPRLNSEIQLSIRGPQGAGTGSWEIGRKRGYIKKGAKALNGQLLQEMGCKTLLYDNLHGNFGNGMSNTRYFC